MRQLKKSLEKNCFNPDDLLDKITAQATQEHIRTQWAKPRGKMHMKTNRLFRFGLIALLVAGVFWVIPPFSFASNPVVAYVSVDINPSFELTVLDNKTVSEIKQLNADAQTIQISDLIGQKVDEAIDAIVARSIAAGFITLDDMDEDFVLVTTVLTDQADDDTDDEISDELQDQIDESETLQDVTVVELKADQRARFEAEGKDVPVGLYVINGEVLQEDGTYLSAKEFFSNADHLKQIETTLNARVTQRSETQLMRRIAKTLDELELKGIDVGVYRARLETATQESLMTMQQELQLIIDSLQAGSTKPDNKPETPANGQPKDNPSQGKGPKDKN